MSNRRRAPRVACSFTCTKGRDFTSSINESFAILKILINFWSTSLRPFNNKLTFNNEFYPPISIQLGNHFRCTFYSLVDIFYCSIFNPALVCLLIYTKKNRHKKEQTHTKKRIIGTITDAMRSILFLFLEDLQSLTCKRLKRNQLQFFFKQVTSLNFHLILSTEGQLIFQFDLVCINYVKTRLNEKYWKIK